MLADCLGSCACRRGLAASCKARTSPLAPRATTSRGPRGDHVSAFFSAASELPIAAANHRRALYVNVVHGIIFAVIPVQDDINRFSRTKSQLGGSFLGWRHGKFQPWEMASSRPS